MVIKLKEEQVRALRLRAQGLLPVQLESGQKPEQVLGEIFAVQAQDFASALHSIRVRSSDLTKEMIEKEIRDIRSIAWIWSIRGTLHLVKSEDARWLTPFLGPGLISRDQGRFRQVGWDEERYISAINLLIEQLSKHGEMTRQEIRDFLRSNDFHYHGQSTVHFLFRSVFEGKLCQAIAPSGEVVYKLFDQWLGKPIHLSDREALERLALRYINAYGPASQDDFAIWSGLNKKKAHEAWGVIDRHITQVQIPGCVSWLPKTHVDWIDRVNEPMLAVRLLPRFDTFWMGYTDRTLAISSQHSKRIFPGGGLINAALLVNGRALGTWKTQTSGHRFQIIVEPFETLSDNIIRLIESEALDIGRFIGSSVNLIMEES